MYQKEIIYLGLYKDGDRLGSAGFLKVEKRDRDGNLSLMVKNVPHSMSGKYPVRYYSGSEWKEADGITMHEGCGQWEKQDADSLEQVRLQVILPGGYLVEGASKEAVRQAAAMNAERVGESVGIEAEAERERDPWDPPAFRGERSSAAESETNPSVSLREKPAMEPVIPEREQAGAAGAAVPGREQADAAGSVAPERERASAAESSVSLQEQQKIERIVVKKQGARESGTVPEQPQRPLMADALAIEGLKEDKWEQILDTYDNIHPYGDERAYVKLEPKDFIILSGKYQHLVNNSFLLHGFYNYRHVILGKEGELYYLGVPGVFYEREKMVALMFGFEAFECASGESKAGEFGYYLRKVEL